MIIFWSGMAFYHQAASLKKFAKFSIPYLLQWEAIKEAKKRGVKFMISGVLLTQKNFQSIHGQDRHCLKWVLADIRKNM